MDHLGTRAISIAVGGLPAMPPFIEKVARRERQVSTRFRGLESQMEVAGRLQRELLCSPLPRVEGLRIRTLFEPAESTSGDLYDVHRLDEDHIGVALADATGHGLPAAFLSVYIKQLLNAKLIGGGNYRLLRPDEVLERLNAQVLAAGLQDCQFAAALYAVYDQRTRIIRWARGGVPYPILVRPGREGRHVPSRGPIVGTFEGASFEVVELQLQPGDRLLLHTDGVDALLLGRRSGLACSQLDRTDWFRGLAEGSMQSHLEGLRRRQAAIEPDDWDPDDVTVVALEAVEVLGESAVSERPLELQALAPAC
jgi:sigma-B regulation protein RsbU (phosphoserine phosphatase)